MSIHARDIDPHEPLEAVLRAASVPGHPEELSGEHAAVVAFLTAAPAPRRRSLLGRVLTVKAMVIGALIASAGVVLAAAGVVLPILRPEPVPTTPPADPPSVAPASVPTRPPSAGLEPVPTTPPIEETTANPPGDCDDCPGSGDEHDNPDDPNRSGKGKDGKDGKQYSPPSTEHSDPADDETTQPSSRTETPDTSAHGAVTAVPPSGAEPPSPGG